MLYREVQLSLGMFKPNEPKVVGACKAHIALILSHIGLYTFKT